MSSLSRYRIGIDVGGTFTDLVLIDRSTGAIARHKLPSTPAQPHIAPLQGIAEILSMVGAEGAEVEFVGLGTTVMTNALLERKGAVTGLITTAGFRDLLEIARQIRPHTFDPFATKTQPLVSRDRRAEVNERMGANGTALRALDLPSLTAAVEQLLRAGVQSIAICFLNSYVNSVHEQAAAHHVRQRWPAGHVCISSDVLPEFREFERLSSTVVNAYLMPVTCSYIRQFASQLQALGVPQPPYVMNSGGGIMTPAQTTQRPIDTLFSGPSGGVSGAVHTAARAGHGDIITFDMGGTSTDVCLVQGGRAKVTHNRTINGIPLKAAALDVHTVGAGGSSIATLDSGNMLRVGPDSTGAQPGPACYGRGGAHATVTDANVVLGRLNPEHLLGGALKIDAARSRDAIERHIAGPRGIPTVEAAASIVALADTNMAHAVRFVSVEKGLDPADFVLVAFGGAGPAHAASVARHLGIARVLVPASPGVLCAMGVLVKDLQMSFGRTRIVSERSSSVLDAANAVYEELAQKAREAFTHRTTDAEPLAFSRSADIRYVGQNHELTVDVPEGILGEEALSTVKIRFHRAHEALYGYSSADKPLEFVTFRVMAQRAIERHDLAVAQDTAASPEPVPIRSRPVYFEEAGHFIDCPVYERNDLRVGHAIRGPAVIEQMDATTVVPPDFRAGVDRYLNLFLRLEPD